MNIIFFVEFLIKSITLGFIFDEKSYLRDSWNCLDFFIVSTSMFDMLFGGDSLSSLKILRLLRTLRPLRFISHNKSLKLIVNALIGSISGLFNVIIIIFLF
jgi:hypothetical protein